MTEFKQAPSKKHSSGLHSFSWEMLENHYFLTAFPEALWVTAETQAEIGSPGRRDSQGEMQEHLSPKLLQLLLPSFPAPSYSEQREGRRESKVNVFSGRRDNKRVKRKEEMSEKARSIKSTQFLWDLVRTALYCFVSYETDKHTKKQIQHHNMQKTYTGVRSQTTAEWFIQFSTMILYNVDDFEDRL